MKINNIWNTDYTSLKQQLCCCEKELSCAKEDLNNRDKQIKLLTKKLELMFVRNSEEGKSLWEQLKNGDDEENDVCKDTPSTRQDDQTCSPMMSNNGMPLAGGFSPMHQYGDIAQENQELRHQNNVNDA